MVEAKVRLELKNSIYSLLLKLGISAFAISMIMSNSENISLPYTICAECARFSDKQIDFAI